MNAVEKVERDGMVAVIVSPRFGAGWSTWADGEGAVFAPDVIDWIEAGKPDDEELMERFGDRYGYTGGLRDALIDWVPVGCRFEIDEYDGAESLRILGPDDGYLA